MKPTIGRIVHFVTPVPTPDEKQPDKPVYKQHHAAMIVYVSEDNRCNLRVWNEFGGTYFHEETPFDPEAKAPNSWHWPEREEESTETPVKA